MEKKNPSISSSICHRLILEDFMQIADNTVLLMLIPTKSKKIVRKWEVEIKEQRKELVHIQKRNFHQIIVTVKRNPSINSLQMLKTEYELNRACYHEKNGCYLVDKYKKNPEPKLVTWIDVLESGKEGIQLWQNGLSKRKYFESFHNNSDSIEKANGVCAGLYGELFGDVGQC